MKQFIHADRARVEEFSQLQNKLRDYPIAATHVGRYCVNLPADKKVTLRHAEPQELEDFTFAITLDTVDDQHRVDPRLNEKLTVQEIAKFVAAYDAAVVKPDAAPIDPKLEAAGDVKVAEAAVKK